MAHTLNADIRTQRRQSQPLPLGGIERLYSELRVWATFPLQRRVVLTTLSAKIDRRCKGSADRQTGTLQ
jgi:hypothetical protein